MTSQFIKACFFPSKLCFQGKKAWVAVGQIPEGLITCRLETTQGRIPECAAILEPPINMALNIISATGT